MVRYMYKSVSALHINISPAESISAFGTDSCIIKLAASHIQNPVFITKYVIKHYKIINNALYSSLVSTTSITFYALSISLICFECFLILFYFFKTHSFMLSFKFLTNKRTILFTKHNILIYILSKCIMQFEVKGSYFIDC